MDNKTKLQIGDVQKTLFMPVWARAVETQKKKPLLSDKTAVEIVNSIYFRLAKYSIHDTSENWYTLEEFIILVPKYWPS